MSFAVIHQTDLFHPHNDPDDHWDVACIYALALAGDIALKGIVIDFPPAGHGDPDVLGLAQMNYITHLNIPFSVGVKELLTSQKKRGDGSYRGGPATRQIIEILKTASDPVHIIIAGSCRDIAIAARQAPELFREQCAGIYLNAGSGGHETDYEAELEYNVRMDPLAFKEILASPCPVYWLPCFEFTTNQLEVCEYGTWYRFLQSDILPHLSDKLQKYFLYMYSRSEDYYWLSYLHRERDHELLNRQMLLQRNMWCTAGIFHAAGKSVTSAGEIISREETNRNHVFTFEPVEVHCDDDGYTCWNPASSDTQRYLFHITNVPAYGKAMTSAMKSLLMTLP